MARVLLLIALCVLPALVSASRPARNPFLVEGRVYCDTCRAGFETSATTYIPDATVRVECRDKMSMNLHFSKEAKTDVSGTYKMLINEDHLDHICDAVLVSSPEDDCKEAAPGRDRARVILTSYNGIASNNRFANSMGFMKDEPMSGCAEVMQQYKLDDESL